MHCHNINHTCMCTWKFSIIQQNFWKNDRKCTWMHIYDIPHTHSHALHTLTNSYEDYTLVISIRSSNWEKYVFTTQKTDETIS